MSAGGRGGSLFSRVPCLSLFLTPEHCAIILPTRIGNPGGGRNERRTSGTVERAAAAASITEKPTGWIVEPVVVVGGVERDLDRRTAGGGEEALVVLGGGDAGTAAVAGAARAGDLAEEEQRLSDSTELLWDERREADPRLGAEGRPIDRVQGRDGDDPGLLERGQQSDDRAGAMPHHRRPVEVEALAEDAAELRALVGGPVDDPAQIQGCLAMVGGKGIVAVADQRRRQPVARQVLGVALVLTGVLL